MARANLTCPCGHAFFVSDEQISPQGSVECPACGDPVKAGAASKPGAKAPAAKSAPRPAPEDASPESRGPSRKKLILIGSGIGAVVVLGIIITLVATSSPSVDYEKQAALAVEQRKRAFEEAVSKSPPGSPTPMPKDPSPLKPSPVAPPRPAVPESQVKAPPSQVAPATSNPAPKSNGATTPVNPDLSAKIRTEVLSLHPFYLDLVLSPTQKSRTLSLLSAGTTAQEEVDFLQALLTGSKLKSVQDEMGVISQTIPTLERESQEGLPVDKVTLTDGRVLNCRIIDEGVDIVKVSRNLTGGVGGQLPLRRETITRLEKGKGVGAEYATRWEAARKGTVAVKVEVLVWCKENGLAGQAKLAAYSILRSDPSNTQARTEAGLPADPVKNAEEVAKGGVIVYQGRSWAPRELKEKFLKEGFFLVDGQWYLKKERSIAVPGLFRYEKQADKPVLIGGVGMLCHDTETVYRMVQDPGATTFTEQTEIRYLRRYYAPAMVIETSPNLPPGVSPPITTYEQDVRVDFDRGFPAQGGIVKGDVTIFVPLGEMIFEASIMTAAEVKAGASIAVFLVKGSGESEKRTKLYNCEGKESQSHVIPPDLIRGSTELSLVATIEETASYTQKVDRRHVRNAIRQGKQVVTPALDVLHYRLIPDYKAVLFPSTPTGVGDVFRVKAVTGELSASLNKLFAANPDALK